MLKPWGWQMELSAADELLEELYRLKRQCLHFIEDAESRADLGAVRTYQRHLANINSIIEEKGGDLTA